ncbi:DNA-binding transcriptional regulator YbjK [Actinoalloteichus hoggarensis]|uniref:Transcriptional regulator BetI n=1 Tax=Actinoalloteichus hoggarensis TaxID=1470176 RepID=A0A221W4M9_9PSEU|nr:TetR family transcriptional regulator [Actinoalloteichus hoggarensis]ASO20606.1 transcriptional regulator BetI [Actinoalloteichus hoggarensis]MBB5923647.1 DNA-binding transcriptional regulator YbjK [Actinoalloteichus hoggarensis]
MTARRNPEARRQAIIDAAVQEMLANGSSALTHRRVAEAAGVPLGATTYYFDSLDDLRTAALRTIAEQAEEELRELAEAVHGCGGSPAGIAELFADYLRDRDRLQAESLLYFAGVYDPGFRPMARQWVAGLTEILSAYTSSEAAKAVAVYLDGVFLHALLDDRPVEAAPLRLAVTALMNAAPKEQS